MILSRYSKIYPHPEDEGLRTLFSTRTMAVAHVPVELIQSINENKLSPREKKRLNDKGFLAKSAAAEKKEMLRFIDDFNRDADTFNAVLVMSLDCNLGCKYCFEGTRKGNYYLSAETADDFINFILTRNFKGKSKLNIVFYGGEPLLSSSAIIRIAEKLQKGAARKKLAFSFSFITNGTLLTPRLVKKLNPLGMTAARVTVDGPKEVHDAYRPFKTGKGSFDIIVKNIREVCGLTEVCISGNYTKGRYREFPRLLDYFLDHDITPGLISSIDFSPVINERNEFTPPGFHGGCMSINEPWLMEAAVFLREETLRRGFRTQELMPSACAIEWKNQFIINYDGTLYKCPGLIGRKDYCVGDVKTGAGDYSLSHQLNNWKNEKCLSCCYLPLCFGGCRYLKLIKDGTMKGTDCKKAFFDRTLESCVQQDMRYNLSAAR
jgi:uncharacterized protein